ncbi:MAG: hypothetical protein LBM01_00290 [Christensenellaceae bacterium]|jgi:hypothetical protein|nr:hypothetical protein [Christensenellaceae bacterium]
MANNNKFESKKYKLIFISIAVVGVILLIIGLITMGNVTKTKDALYLNLYADNLNPETNAMNFIIGTEPLLAIDTGVNESLNDPITFSVRSSDTAKINVPLKMTRAGHTNLILKDGAEVGDEIQLTVSSGKFEKTILITIINA